jgi:acyl-coenzyme A thioesterase PaaI-like protein
MDRALDSEILTFAEDAGCFGCSRSNGDGLRLQFRRRGDSVVCEYAIPDRFHGAPGIAHGGIVATILDEVSCSAAYFLRGSYVVTGELSVRYEKPCPVEVDIVAAATIVEVRPRYLIVEGRVTCDDVVLARSTGRFFPVDRPTAAP